MSVLFLVVLGCRVLRLGRNAGPCAPAAAQSSHAQNRLHPPQQMNRLASRSPPRRPGHAFTTLFVAATAAAAATAATAAADPSAALPPYVLPPSGVPGRGPLGTAFVELAAAAHPSWPGVWGNIPPGGKTLLVPLAAGARACGWGGAGWVPALRNEACFPAGWHWLAGAPWGGRADAWLRLHSAPWGGRVTEHAVWEAPGQALAVRGGGRGAGGEGGVAVGGQRELLLARLIVAPRRRPSRTCALTARPPPTPSTHPPLQLRSGLPGEPLLAATEVTLQRAPRIAVTQLTLVDTPPALARRSSPRVVAERWDPPPPDDAANGDGGDGGGGTGSGQQAFLRGMVHPSAERRLAYPARTVLQLADAHPGLTTVARLLRAACACPPDWFTAPNATCYAWVLGGGGVRGGLGGRLES